MHPVRPVTRKNAIAATGALATALASAPAFAASGGLEILPDARALWLIALFVVLVWPANQLLWKPLLRALDERQSRIAGTRERGDAIGAEADEVFGRYSEAVERARIAAEENTREQRDEARREQGRVTGAARRDAEEKLSAARAEVEAALQTARGELGVQARELAKTAASQALGRELG